MNTSDYRVHYRSTKRSGLGMSYALRWKDALEYYDRFEFDYYELILMNERTNTIIKSTLVDAKDKI